MSSYCL